MAHAIGDVEGDFDDGIEGGFAAGFEIITRRKDDFVSSRGDLVAQGKQILDAPVGIGFSVGERLEFFVVQVLQADLNVGGRQARV